MEHADQPIMVFGLFSRGWKGKKKERKKGERGSLEVEVEVLRQHNQQLQEQVGSTELIKL